MTRLRLILVSVIIVVSLGFLACSQHVSWVVVDASDSGDAVKVRIGAELFVTLDSNPTTGFQWELIEVSDKNVLEQVAHEFKRPESEAIPGTGGIERWTFKAIKEGTTRLYMEYSQPWEVGTKSAETFTLIVIVE